ncbi:MAG: hypothetical protein LH616_11650 [Ilumatobacteraceae bacterium]|nr:hypothetical protein [Ilumatobacteraceae bacterium]
MTVIVREKGDVSEETDLQPDAPSVRESIQVQALLAEIGVRMGMQIWIPKADRAGVLAAGRGDHGPLLDRLPLNYDDTTLRTTEQIDVLWLKGRSIRRAFEVGHTTSVYSGILRMADLLALQPNINIKLHIVAPAARREKVRQELMRPIFSLLDHRPLSDSCTYIRYDGVRQLAEKQHLAHMSDSVVDDYCKSADVWQTGTDCGPPALGRHHATRCVHVRRGDVENRSDGATLAATRENEKPRNSAGFLTFGGRA